MLVKPRAGESSSSQKDGEGSKQCKYELTWK